MSKCEQLQVLHINVCINKRQPYIVNVQNVKCAKLARTHHGLHLNVNTGYIRCSFGWFLRVFEENKGH